MKNRIHLQHKKSIIRGRIFFFSLIGISLGIMIMLFFLSSKIWPILMCYAKVDAKYIVTEIMNQAVKNKIAEQLQTDKLFTTNKDEKGNISMIEFDSVVINKILAFTNQIVRDNLKALEYGDVEVLQKSDIILDNALFKQIKKGLVSSIPIGNIFNNALLSNLGPKIPVKIHFIGNVTSNVTTRVSSYGINNAMMEIFVKIDVTMQIVLPLSLEEIKVITEIPISMRMIQGQVPSYYQNGYNNKSPLSSIPFMK